MVDPGSVGLQADDDVHPHPHWVENGSTEARWALLERDACGDWADALGTGFVGRDDTSAPPA